MIFVGGHICQYRQSFMEWLNLEGIGDKKNSVQNFLNKTITLTPGLK
jgi:hypothetical protein